MRTERFVVSRIAVLTDTRGRRLLLLVALALILGLLVGTLARAGFVDDWITQHTETSPGYFEGQKRGYFTGEASPPDGPRRRTISSPSSLRASSSAAGGSMPSWAASPS